MKHPEIEIEREADAHDNACVELVVSSREERVHRSANGRCGARWPYEVAQDRWHQCPGVAEILLRHTKVFVDEVLKDSLPRQCDPLIQLRLTVQSTRAAMLELVLRKEAEDVFELTVAFVPLGWTSPMAENTTSLFPWNSPMAENPPCSTTSSTYLQGTSSSSKANP